MKKQQLTFSFLTLALVVVGLLFSSPAHAVDWPVAVAQFIGNGVAVIVWLLGRVLVIVINLVVWVAQYNGFIKSSAVSQGWIIVRDICNMFFIVILLIIAFGTVLNQEKYSWKHLLPKVLLAAVLINFSKLICGLLIDFGQVVMLSFVNGFRDIAGGNFANMAGISRLLGVSSNSGEVTVLSLAGTYVMALLYVIVALVVMVVILFILVIRIVMIWILVVLSPLAYFLHAVPGKGESYAGKWWEQFTSYVVSGPILAFFIWLSFVAIDPSKPQPLDLPERNDAEKNLTGSIAQDSKQLSAGLSETGTPEGMLKFIVSVGMLIGGLMITSQLGGMAGSIAGAGMSKIQNGAKGLKKFGAKRAQLAGKFAGQTALRASGSLAQVVGNKINKEMGGKFGESLQKSGAFLNSWGGDIRKSRKEAKVKKRKETLEALGMKEGTADKLKAAADTKLGRSIKGAGAVVAGTAMMNPFGVGMAIGGASHMFTALAGNFIGRWAKAKVVESQQKKDTRLANGSLEGIENRKATELKERLKETPEQGMEREIKEKEKERMDKLQAADRESATLIRNAKNSNATPEEISALQSQAEAKRRSINIAADLDISQIRENFQNKLQGFDDYKLHVQAEIDAKYAPQIEEIKKFKENAVGARERDTGLKEIEDKRQIELSKNASERSKEYSETKKLYAGAPEAVRDAKLDEVNTKYRNKDKETNEWHDLLAQEHQNEKFGHIKDNELTWAHRPAGFLADQAVSYQPNKLTILGAEELAKEIKTAADMIRNLATNGFDILKSKDFSSAKGIDKVQEHFYGKLAKGDEWSKDAMGEMVKAVEAMPKVLSGDQAKIIASLKTGLAFYFKKKPGDKGAFKKLTDILNTLSTGDKKGRMRIEEYAKDDHAPAEHKESKPKGGGDSHAHDSKH